MPKLAFAPFAHVTCEPVEIAFEDDTDLNILITSPKENGETLSFVSPACVTHQPRQVCSRLDLNEYAPNAGEFISMALFLDKLDEQLLDFVHEHQLQLFGVTHLSKDLCRNMQYRSVEYDVVWLEGVGKDKVCDRHGNLLPGVDVSSGDVVAAAMYVSEVFVNRGEGQFGIVWTCDDVCIVRQRDVSRSKSEKTVLHQMHRYPFSHDFVLN